MLTAQCVVEKVKGWEFPLLPENHFMAGILNSLISALPAAGMTS